MSPDPETLPHSAIYFGDARDHWWNVDFLDLVARRIDLPRHRKVLDVGCGYGHWTRLWLSRLSPDAEVTGVDREARSLAEARSRTDAFAEAKGLSVKTTWQEASVEALPFPDGAFDLVTAQTVLLHVRDVGVAVDEMTRVLAPRGLLLLAEPDNLAGAMAAHVTSPDLDVPRALRALELEMRIQRGKFLCGDGFNSAGEILPAQLDHRRFAEVRQWLCDRPYGLFPPYDRPGAREEIAEWRDFLAQGWHGRPPDEARRWFLAGGGTEAAFEVAWAEGLEEDRRMVEGIDAGTWSNAGGHVFHLFAARKRE